MQSHKLQNPLAGCANTMTVTQLMQLFLALWSLPYQLRL